MTVAFSTLSAADQKRVTDYITNLRSVAGEIARVMNHCDAYGNIAWNTGISTLVGTLDTTPIPDGSALSGAAQLTAAEVTTLTAHLQNLTTGTAGVVNDTTHRQVWAKACGAGNVIG